MQPDLSNVKKRIGENRDLIDNLTNKLGNLIPGFKGFVEAAESYAADQVVRDFMADRIQKIKNDISDIITGYSKESKFEYLGELDTLNMNFEKLHRKVKYADYGTSASASKLKVTEADKERLLEYDWRLLSGLDEFNEALSKLGTAQGDDFKSAVKAVREKSRNFETMLDERKNVIMEVI